MQPILATQPPVQPPAQPANFVSILRQLPLWQGLEQPLVQGFSGNLNALNALIPIPFFQRYVINASAIPGTKTIDPARVFSNNTTSILLASKLLFKLVNKSIDLTFILCVEQLHREYVKTAAREAILAHPEMEFRHGFTFVIKAAEVSLLFKKIWPVPPTTKEIDHQQVECYTVQLDIDYANLCRPTEEESQASNCRLETQIYELLERIKSAELFREIIKAYQLNVPDTKLLIDKFEVMTDLVRNMRNNFPRCRLYFEHLKLIYKDAQEHITDGKTTNFDEDIITYVAATIFFDPYKNSGKCQYTEALADYLSATPIDFSRNIIVHTPITIDSPVTCLAIECLQMDKMPMGQNLQFLQKNLNDLGQAYRLMYESLSQKTRKPIDGIFY